MHSLYTLTFMNVCTHHVMCSCSCKCCILSRTCPLPNKINVHLLKYCRRWRLDNNSVLDPHSPPPPTTHPTPPLPPLAHNPCMRSNPPTISRNACNRKSFSCIAILNVVTSVRSWEHSVSVAFNCCFIMVDGGAGKAEAVEGDPGSGATVASFFVDTCFVSCLNSSSFLS